MDLREELVNLYPKLENYAFSQTRDRSAAEDCAMESITKILSANPEFESQSHLTGYAITTVKRQIIDRSRVASRISGEEIPDVEDTSPSGSIMDVTRALEKLGGECQKILELFGTGHKYKEIGDKLNIAIGTVMSRMARCRSEFKDILEA